MPMPAQPAATPAPQPSELAIPPSLARNSLITVAIGNYLVQQAMMPVSVTLPTITDEFGVPLGLVGWVMTGYLLMLIGWGLTAGRVGDIVGHRRVYLAGLALYVLAAVACSLAWDIWSLIGFRALQGLGGAMMLGNSLAILVHAFPQSQHGKVIGTAMMAASLGSTVGVAVGSLAISLGTWRWLYVSLVPFGLLGLLLGWRAPALPVPRRQRRIDWLGASVLFLALSAASLSLVHLHEGEESFEAGWPYHTAMQVAAVVLLGVFYVVERRTAEPIVIFPYLRNLRFTLPLLAHGVLHLVMMGTIFLVPFVIERGFLLLPAATASFLVTRQVLSIVSAPLAGWLYDRTRSPFIAPACMLGIALSLGVLAWYGEGLTFEVLALVMLPTSAFVGMFQAANNTAVMAALPSEVKGFASGMLETMRQLGHGSATSIITAIMSLAVVPGLVGADASAGYLTGFQQGVLLMAILSAFGVFASLYGSFTLLRARRSGATPAVAAAPGSGPPALRRHGREAT